MNSRSATRVLLDLANRYVLVTISGMADVDGVLQVEMLAGRPTASVA
jgi:hypothetical protein